MIPCEYWHLSDRKVLEDHHAQEHRVCSSSGCQEVFDSDESLREHRRLRHWYCEKCNTVFIDENSLKIHLRASETHNERTILCPGEGCGKLFISPSDLTQHLESGACRSRITRTDVNNIAAKFDTNRVITNPDRMLTGGDDMLSYLRPRIAPAYAMELSFNGTAYECILCHRTFATLSRLHEHMASPVHEAKIYHCPSRYGGCEIEFKTLSGLIRHVESQVCDVLHFVKKPDPDIGAVRLLEYGTSIDAQHRIIDRPAPDDSNTEGGLMSTMGSLFVSILLAGGLLALAPILGAVVEQTRSGEVDEAK
ncbi:hypothetical protein NM688_g7767 [Phlebia brevispora]|uniref:Uncharacterized protein n=1 Tax=Phlebia brevispora TaxID=194682 RepID=A0ACC1S1M6_9APHY|nr:hypothetical protein NM688_g7767 [Phlebia brevispora]